MNKAQEKVINDRMTELNNSVNEKNIEIARLNDELTSLQNQSEKLKVENNNLVSVISKSEETISLINNQLNDKELKRMAQAFGSQETEHRKTSNMWGQGFIATIILLLFVTAYILDKSVGLDWHSQLKFIVLDLIAFSATWFTGSQYSEYKTLANDYANRKTLAQTYHNIIDTVTDDTLKSKFIEASIATLTAPAYVNKKNVVISKELVTQLNEFIRTVKG